MMAAARNILQDGWVSVHCMRMISHSLHTGMKKMNCIITTSLRTRDKEGDEVYQSQPPYQGHRRRWSVSSQPASVPGMKKVMKCISHSHHTRDEEEDELCHHNHPPYQGWRRWWSISVTASVPGMKKKMNCVITTSHCTRDKEGDEVYQSQPCLLYTSPSPRD